MTQNEHIERHLKKYGSITTMEAFTEYGITRISARIFELRKNGMNISDRWETKKNRFDEPVRYVRYTLEERND